MNRLTLTLMLIVVLGGAQAALAQTQRTDASASATHSTSARADGQRLNIASGTRLAAQLQNTLDVRRAKVGDRVVLKTTEDLKANGRTVVRKGARLIGHVTEVQQRAKGGAESRVGLVFDRLESGSLTVPITATLSSITQAGARGRVDDDEMSADAGVRGGASARSGGSSGGGVLSGVTGAVGNTVGTVAGTTSDVLTGTTETVGGTARGVGRTVGSIRITQSGSASAEGGSTLSLAGGDLRLEKGTTFRLTLTESASVGRQ